ncbi:SET domain-containing family protein [Salix suchowensis]|nr:SET domain-containing family protein [Salix suchowensis]
MTFVSMIWDCATAEAGSIFMGLNVDQKALAPTLQNPCIFSCKLQSEYDAFTSPPVYISPLDLGPKCADNSFYAKVQKPSQQRIYGPKTVKMMLERMEKYPQKPWPRDQIWSFKSSPKVFGSPMLDAVLNNSPLDREMLHWLKHRPSFTATPFSVEVGSSFQNIFPRLPSPHSCVHSKIKEEKEQKNSHQILLSLPCSYNSNVKTHLHWKIPYSDTLLYYPSSIILDSSVATTYLAAYDRTTYYHATRVPPAERETATFFFR